MAAGAVGRAQDVNSFLDSKGRFFESELDLIVQVGSRLWRTSPSTGGAGEEGIEDVSHPEEIVKAFEAPSCPHVTEMIIAGPLLGIAQYLISFVDFFEPV